MTGAAAEDGSAVSETRGKTARGRLAAISVLLLLVAAACLWGASRMTWVTVTSFDGLGEERTTDLVGSTWAAATTPLALALLAAVAASFAVRGWASRILAVLVALVAVGAAVPAVQALVSGASDDRAATLAELPARAEVTATEVYSLPALLTLLGAASAMAAAVVLMRKPTSRKVLSSKYDAPAARREEVLRRAESAAAGTTSADEGDDLTERMLWDALDAGEDPTDGSGTRTSNG